MIKFETSKSNLKTAVFGGTFDDVLAELCLEISLIYGGIARQNNKAAKEFRSKLMMALIEPELSETLFSTELVDSIHESDHYECGSVAVGDPEELMKQLKEMLNESE